MNKFVIVQVEEISAIVFEGLMFNSYEDAMKFLQTKALRIIEEQTGISYVRVEPDRECDLLISKKFPKGNDNSNIAFTIFEIHEYAEE